MSSEPTQTIDLTSILEPYLNKWVALSANQTKVIGSGDDVTQALKEAHEKGEPDPVVLFVPSVSGPHVLIG